MTRPKVDLPSPGDDGLVARLRAAGCVFAEEEAALLLAAADGAGLEALVVRRVAGEPLEHVLGRVGFAGLELAVGPGGFVPRQRTVRLARRAVALAHSLPSPVVVDLCCGVGAVAALVCAEVPEAEVLAADVDPVALGYARENLPRAEVCAGDLYAALPDRLRGRVDVLACNAPYVPTAQLVALPPEARDHEPTRTLDGGRDGLDVHRRVVAEAPAWLAPGGTLLIEVAASQVTTATRLMGAAGLAPSAEPDDVGTAVLLGRFC